MATPALETALEEMEKLELIQGIAKAFPVEPKSGMSIHQAQLADQSLDREITETEWEREAQKDKDKCWTDLTDREIVFLDAALSHIDTNGFVYYLPAFMIFSLKHIDSEWNEFGSDAVTMTLFHVTDRTSYNLVRLKSLSYDQVDVVIDFLRYFRDSNHSESEIARKSLERFWETGEPKRKLGENFL